jgi:ATP-binding cassette subfamily C protein CydC
MDRRQRALASLAGAGEAALVAAASLAVWGAALLAVPAVTAGLLPRAHLAMLTVFVLATFEAVMPLPAVIQRAGEMAAAARRLFELIDAPPPVAEPTMPRPVSARGLPPALGVSVRGLRFRYAPGQPWVFDGLSLDVPVGARVAITGPTGAGKSTLVSLLLRFWEYEAGEIAVREEGGDRQDLRGFRGEDARLLFSVVPQSPHLFHATLRENLLLAAPESDDPALVSALAAAQLGDLLSRLPDGLDTVAGETGRELSAGECKRVAVARALLKKAPVYLLDEPTEGLDSGTADALLAAVDERVGRGTLVIISHRERDLALARRVIRLGFPNGEGRV